MQQTVPTVLFRRDDDTWEAFIRQIHDGGTEAVIVVLSPRDQQELTDELKKRALLQACGRHGSSVTVATRSAELARECKSLGFQVMTNVQALHQLLRAHPQEAEAVRVFSPHVWQQQLRSRLQAVGLLSLPRIRIWTLIVTSIVLFLFVMFRLLPSAEVRVWPRQDTVSQTVNIYLVQSGAVVPSASSVRRIPLVPLTVEVKKSITFDHIHRVFTGRPAQVTMKIFNDTADTVPLRDGSRLFHSSGGLLFRLKDPVIIDPHTQVTVTAVAADEDVYGAIIGERGNVHANLDWTFPGLPEADQKKIYAKNVTSGQGGTTSSRLVFKQEDLDAAHKELDTQLISTARTLIDEQLSVLNQKKKNTRMQYFDDKQLIRAIFHDVKLPTEFLGETVTSVPAEGSVTYTVIAYNADSVLTLLQRDLISHIEEGKQLVADSVSADGLRTFLIKYDDNLAWVKVTAELNATEEFVLDPLLPVGAKFGRNVRDTIVGLAKGEAIKIIKNMPEVERAEIHTWPPWSGSVTQVPANISIRQQ
ncbi:MAG: hypothetical protein JWM56_1356 [Candidatus Peribacteria bacterium]|nr:hypothetical protein [Candidatus Peribacteria bacterium]